MGYCADRGEPRNGAIELRSLLEKGRARERRLSQAPIQHIRKAANLIARAKVSRYAGRGERWLGNHRSLGKIPFLTARFRRSVRHVMKKVIFAVVLLAAVAVGAFFALKKVINHRPRAAELVPAETVFFAQIPDTFTSARRFTKTALWDIFQEPEMQEAFGNGAAGNGAALEDWREVARVLPREGFAAITSIDGAIPKFVAGFAFSGRQKDAEALAVKWRAALRQSRPAGRADLKSYGEREIEIETFTDKDFVLAEVFCDGWYLLADDIELLERTIDRLDGKIAETSLAASDFFKQAIAPLPGEPDALLVAQTATMIERVASLMVAAGQQNDPKEFDELRKVKAISATMKFDGANCRDSIFVLRPGGATEAPLARNALALSSPATLLYYAMNLPATFELSEQTAPMLALVPGWDALNQSLTEKNLALANLPKAFGPEFGSVVEWAKDADTASVLLALDVRDAEKAAAFVDLVTTGKAGDLSWQKTQHGDATFFTTSVADFTPAIALTGKFVLIGLSADSVTKGLAQLQSGAGRLDSTPAFASASSAVTAPTSGFGYIDLRTLFDRAYGPLKSLLGVSLAFSSEAGQHLDAGKLPPAETISRHLGPIVYSQATTERGTLIESTGPVTFNQILIAATAGVIGTTLPAMEAALADGSLDPAQLMKDLQLPAGAAIPSEPVPVDPAAE